MSSHHRRQHRSDRRGVDAEFRRGIGDQQAGTGSVRRDPRRGVDPVRMQSSFWRTKPCKFYAAGVCTRGDACVFAHGTEDLRPQLNLYRTRMCPSLIASGRCVDEGMCRFAHRREDIRKPTLLGVNKMDVGAVIPDKAAPRLQINRRSLNVAVRSHVLPSANSCDSGGSASTAFDELETTTGPSGSTAFDDPKYVVTEGGRTPGGQSGTVEASATPRKLLADGDKRSFTVSWYDDEEHSRPKAVELPWSIQRSDSGTILASTLPALVNVSVKNTFLDFTSLADDSLTPVQRCGRRCSTGHGRLER